MKLKIMEKPQITLLNIFVLIIIITTGLNHKVYSSTLRPHIQHHSAQKHFIEPSAPHIVSTAHILIDVNSGKILAEKDIDTKRPPASLTKMMTVYVAFSALKTGQIKLTDKATISSKAWKTPGSKMFIRQGQKVSVEDLLQGIIVDSGNDASVALAEYVAGSEKNFVVLMNKHAKSLGMSNSNFTDSTGLPDKNLYSTAKDLAILARAVIKDYPNYMHWFKQKWFTFNGIKQPNRNRLLWRNSYVDGMKTGHTDAAGYALVASAKKNNMRLVSVILGSPSDSARADSGQKLLNYAFRFFETHKVYAANAKITESKIWKGKASQINLGIKQALYLTIPTGSYSSLDINSSLKKHIEAPINRGEELGELVIRLNGKTLAKRPLISLNNVPKGSLFSRLGDSISLSFNKIIH